MTPVDSYRKLAAELKVRAVKERSATLASEYELGSCLPSLAKQADRKDRLNRHVEVGPTFRPKKSDT